jgi:hypothetical protein
MGFGAPQQFSFTVVDTTNSIVVLPEALVIWTDEINNVCLYQGYVKDIAGIATGPYARWTVTCNDLSEALDFAHPVIAFSMTGGTDQDHIQALLGQYSFLHLGVGGFVQILLQVPGAQVYQVQPTMPLNTQSMTTLRNAIDTTLALTAVPNAAYYVDPYGRLHTLTTGDEPAPFAISDVL